MNDLLKGIGNVVNPKRVFRELTDFKPGEFVLIAVMLLAQLVSFFVSKDFRGRLNWSDFRPMHRVQSHSRRPWATDQLSVGLHRLRHLADRCHHEPSLGDIFAQIFYVTMQFVGVWVWQRQLDRQEKKRV